MIFGKVLQHFLACRNGFFDQLLLEIVIQKSSKIPSKIVSGGSSEPPEWLREASGRALGTLPSSARVFVTQKGSRGKQNLATFGLKVAPGRSRKSTENRLFAKKGAPRKAFLSIFAACAVFLDFSFDFGSILSEKSMFFRTRFPHGVCVFFEMATLTIVWFLQCESYFFGFGLFNVLHSKC